MKTDKSKQEKILVYVEPEMKEHIKKLAKRDLRNISTETVYLLQRILAMDEFKVEE